MLRLENGYTVKACRTETIELLYNIGLELTAARQGRSLVTKIWLDILTRKAENGFVACR